MFDYYSEAIKQLHKTTYLSRQLAKGTPQDDLIKKLHIVMNYLPAAPNNKIIVTYHRNDLLDELRPYKCKCGAVQLFKRPVGTFRLKTRR